MKIALIAIFSALTLTGFGQYKYSQPQLLDDGWKTDVLENSGIDSTLYYKFFDDFLSADHKVHSFLIIRNNQIILEEYFGEHNKGSLHDLRSVSKSIKSLLLGIAIDKGFVESVTDPVFNYLKKAQVRNGLDEEKSGITFQNLITMSSGLDCNDWDSNSKGQEDRIYKKNNWLKYIFDLPLINTPGDTSLYCSAGSMLTAEAIVQSSGMPIDQFAKETLFDPIGIDTVNWNHTTKSKSVLPSSRRLYLTSRSLAKIGQLVLDRGIWDGEQVVPPSWIKESTSAHTRITNLDYGYFWWKIPFRHRGGLVEATVATGNGGQYLMIFPDFDLVVVFTGGAYNSPDDKLPFIIVDKVVLPSLKE